MIVRPEPKFELSAAERDGALWLKLAAHLEKQLAYCRIQNDGDKTEIETAAIRGRIACLKSLLALSN